MKQKGLLTVFVFALSLMLSACMGTQINVLETSPPIAYWPTDGWLSAAPEDHGMDGDRLAEMFSFIDGQAQQGLDSVVVVRNGYIVAEKYFPPQTQDTAHVLYSCTKSVISVLVGIAVEEGYIDGVDGYMVDFFPDDEFALSSDEKVSMTLEDVLLMRSGLGWVEGSPAYSGLYNAMDPIGYVMDMPMVASPGTDFNYCTGCSHVLSGILQATTAMNTFDYAQEKLFGPLGIENVYWERDQNGLANGGWGIEITPRDMAKFGQLYLHDGEWDGEQIVPSAWVHESIDSAQNAYTEVDYGYQWWVYPEWNMYAAQGIYGQAIYVIPDYDMVVVFTADLENTSIEYRLVTEWIIPAVIE